VFEHVRLREVLLEGCEVALLDEEAALGVFGDAHDDVCVIGAQPELEVGIRLLASNVDHQERVRTGLSVEAIFYELKTTDFVFPVAAEDKVRILS